MTFDLLAQGQNTDKLRKKVVNEDIYPYGSN